MSLHNTQNVRAQALQHIRLSSVMQVYPVFSPYKVWECVASNMAVSSRVYCPGSGATCNLHPISRRLGVQKGLRVLVSVVLAFALCDFLHFPVGVRATSEPEAAPDPSCVVGETATKCTCKSQESAANKALTATLSEEKNVLEIGCQPTEQQCAPDGLSKNLVCPAATTELKDCKKPEEKSANTPFDVNSLLIGSPKISWQSCEDSECTTKRLTIPRENFPFVDHKFVVGCLKTDTTTMKVAVTLQARASSTQEQTVRCAYGTQSNAKHQTITLTPGKNSFTLVCGSEGEVLPTKYNEAYCVSENGKEAAAHCTGAYTDIFPNYKQTWWSTANINEFTFQVPDGEFPSEEQKITVGCQKKTQATPPAQSQGKRTTPEEANSTVCTVDVTISPSTASSAAFGGVSAFLLLLVGIVSAIVL
ncbi:SAG-related sequence SRS30D [Toxoplasma gondii GAB2-2007-GAL-DOM2]|uniref:SAG-related sequence SRS30D n=6 Tax=Toxoplasma gondii TaxID=5811 RepID=S7V3C4_TOXGG|nr:SAG-related sequence SRS30D [Toxoplasma gondii GT1]KAF4642068.1 SAG-related sequence SRS30D [Toxoplasma gondii]KFG43041.1 SAG-related sequence SRS30D [Toxoplasma gondii GAB2-2007-GAL-DOM2]KFG50147.1 SAG-related sequence SRS30D [Toxoplasma gondii FOU]PUA92367.1 SAG-related sequence SRS30D [Toxoplasma gondii TgCATBr9]RQX75523.1 SAG-related sequence SRS30D [Toxoplasma gondii CAST]